MTVAIAYPGGAYGTYLEWCLTTLTSNDEMVLPFELNGSSHKFGGNHLADINGCKKFKKSPDINFIRFHPKVNKDESILKNLDDACKIFDFIIYLYPDNDSVLLTINNAYAKIWTDWWENRVSTDLVFYSNLQEGWDIKKYNQPTDIPIWIQREILSYNLMPSWFSEVEWGYQLAPPTNPQVKLVLINELLYDFENTILKIQKFCNLKFSKSINDLLDSHNTMLSLQSFLNQDRLCAKIISAVVNDQYFSWKDQVLPLLSQSWIQWKLRELGFEMECHGLDKFPVDSIQLKKLLYLK